MELLNEADFQEWCRLEGFRVERGRMRLQGEHSALVAAEFPQGQGPLVGLGVALLSVGSEGADFKGGMLWISSWNIWNKQYDEVGG